MKTVDASLQAYLQQCIDLGLDELPYCELYTLTLASGDVLNYTDFDASLIVNGTTYLGTGLVIPDRGNISSKVGTEVEEMELHFHLGQDDNGNFAAVLRGMTMHMLAAAGWLAQAQVTVSRLFWSQPPEGAIALMPPWAPVLKFSGKIQKATEILRTICSFDCAAWTQLLQRNVPQTIMSPGCPYKVGDARCGVTLATYAVNCVAGAGCTQTQLVAAQLTQADEYFSNGFLVFTSGANQGIAASIKYSTLAAGLRLDGPLPAAVAAGDTFIAYPGCDNTAATCASKFNNAGNFSGQPYVPAPEIAFL
jgi:uncharacterized phage protein (TIGR02218 family)